VNYRIHIEQGLPQSKRLLQLNRTAIVQMKSLADNNHIKQLSAVTSDVERWTDSAAIALPLT